MVYKPFCLMFALAISKTASQNLSVTPQCIEAEALVTLSCTTTDFSSTVLFYLNGVNKGGCTTVTCGTSISGYSTPTQSGTNTEMIINVYNHSRDGGDWTCNFGATPSDPYTVELGNCGSSGSPDNTKSTIGMAVGIPVAAIVVIAIIAVVLYRIYVKKGPSFAPQQPLVIEFTSSDFVQISWKRPQNVNEVLIKYHIDAEDMSSNVWSSLVKDIVDTTYDVKISNLPGSGVRFRVKSECKNVVSKPLLSNEYLLLEDKYKPSAPLKVQRRDNMCVLSWASPIKRDHGQIKYRIDVQWMGSMDWKTIKEDVMEVNGSVDISDLQGKGVLFRVIAKHDNGVSKPLIAEENLYLEPKHFE